jgi:3-oxoacyl-[acyl-carrier-protein] synthase II
VSTGPRRVVVTGMGVCSAAGFDIKMFWERLVGGVACARHIRRFDTSGFPSRIAAEIDDAEFRQAYDLSDEWRLRGPMAQYGAAAVGQAIEDARLTPASAPPDRIGVSMAAGMGSYDHEEVFGPCGTGARLSPDPTVDWPALYDAMRRMLKPRSAERRTPGAISAHIANEREFRGPAMSVMTACAGGTQAIGDAMNWIRSGRADIVVAGGADSELYPMGLASFCLLGALSRRNDSPTTASRPFDADRDGFVMGEGAGALVLEELGHATARGARIYAEAAGFGSACDAYRVTDPHPDGLGARLAMTRALRNAAVTTDEVEYVNAHGTSTMANDRIESMALAQIFGDRAKRVPVSSTKSMIGHATVAAGAIEAIVMALTLTTGTVHPTINQDRPDPTCDLDYVPNHARRVNVGIAVSNSFAFGGQTASLVLRRYEG